MPYKDPKSRKTMLQEKYAATFQVRITKAEQAIVDAIEIAAARLGVSNVEYMRIATREKLIRDGFLSEDEK